jgi:hypothetical protein
MSVAKWLYVSKSLLSTAEAAAEIEFIVAISRRRNHEFEVTGALLFTGSMFAQFLEGPVASVRTLRGDISRDSRHIETLTISEGTASDRRFADWSLAYSGPSFLVAKIVEEARRDAETEPARAADKLLRLLSNFSPLA